MKYVGDPIPITTANGEVKIHAQVKVFVKELCSFVWAYFLDCDVAVLSLGMLCDDEGFTYQWVANTPPTLTKDGFTVTCYPSHNVPVIFPAALLAGGGLTEDENGAGFIEVISKQTKKTAAPAAAHGNLGHAPKKRSRP